MRGTTRKCYRCDGWLYVRDVRFGVRCGVDLDSPGKRCLEFSEGRR